MGRLFFAGDADTNTILILNSESKDFWIIIDSYSPNNPVKVRGDCITLAKLMQKIIQLLGDNSAQTAYVYARSLSWEGLVNNTHSKNERKRLGGIRGIFSEKLWLGFYTRSFNNFEGCCVFQNRWWMGGLGIAKGNPYDVLMYVSLNNKDKGHNEDNGKRQCWDQTNNPNSHYNNKSVPYPKGLPTAKQQTIP
jgi:hypothetical protein